ncbi:MAG TPA: hypothetical protein VLI05_03245 [Candidatus Saccharimonadia bacterium]|nr:hypothetical protein [Candidatus Saccharimonadia bacterium]
MGFELDNLFLQIIIALLVVLAAGMKSLRFAPSHETDFEIHRRAADGDAEAKREQEIRAIIPLQQSFRHIDLLILNILVVVYVANSYELFKSIALAFIWLVAVNLLASNQWFHRHAQWLAVRHRKWLSKAAGALEPVLNLLGNSRFFAVKRQTSFSSKEELLKGIEESRDILSPHEKRQIRDILEHEA